MQGPGCSRSPALLSTISGCSYSGCSDSGCRSGSDWCFPDSGSCSDYCAPSCARLLSLFLLADIVLTGKSKNIPWDFHFFGQIVVDKPENRAYTT